MPRSPTSYTAPQFTDGITGQLGAVYLNALTASIVAYIQSELGKVADYADDVGSATQVGSAYTFALADVGRMAVGNRATAQTFTIPPHNSVPLAVGATLPVLQYGAGQITLAAGAGVTLRVPAGHVARTFGQYSVIQAWQIAQDEWVLGGDLA